MKNDRLNELTEMAAAIFRELPPVVLSGCGAFYRNDGQLTPISRFDVIESWHRARVLTEKLHAALQDEPRNKERGKKA